MSRFNGTAIDFWSNVFGNREPEQLEEELETLDKESLEARRNGTRLNRPSLYVRVFEDMVDVIMDQEMHLLTDSEWDVLKVYRRLNYHARYLLVRLVFRQPEWHPLSALQKYSAEIGEEELEAALRALCVPVKDMDFDTPPSHSPDQDIRQEEAVKDEEGLIDLTLLDEEDEPPRPALLGLTQKPTQASLQKPSNKTSDHEVEEPIVDPSNLQFDYLFRDQSTMTVREALSRLTLPDLREISRTMKVGTLTMRKETLINAMINHATGQHTLPSFAKRKARTNAKQTNKYDGFVQTQLSFGQKPKDISQMKRLREMALERLGPCVKINPNLYWLVGRLHIIAYRGTEKPTKLCLPALLAGFKKWNFPEYQYERSGSIWPTREDLLEYEEALYLDVEMENPPEDNSGASSSALEICVQTPTTLAKAPSTPRKIPQTDAATPTPKVREGTSALPPPNALEEQEQGILSSQSIQRARHATKLYKERIEAKWRALIARKDQEKGKAVVRAPGLERFEAGHVYTRMAHKAATAFGQLKNHRTELGIIEQLLDQTHWRKGKRPTWYERHAIILEKYILPTDLELVKKVILQALADEFTGLITRPSLARRLERIQKRMKLHPENWIRCDVALQTPTTIAFTAKRSDLKPGVKLDQSLRPMKANIPLLVTDFFLVNKAAKEEEEKPDPDDPNVIVIQLAAPKATPKRTGKSSWVGFNDEVVNVERYALQRYEMEGYVGFHSETRVLTTIFALVFWDIIFSPVPGAFETKFQAGPLDMFEDSFYLSRRHLFEVRLKEIEDGRAREYLKRHDDMFRPKQTWCIGLRWDVCEQNHLVEIIECLGAKTVAMICRLFCEDYGGRSSGVPDLIVWKMNEGICKFVEVKGPGDHPQPNQKLWFDSLLRAGANVEICRIIDEDAPEPKKRQKRKTPSKQQAGRKGKRKVVSRDLEERREEGHESDDDGDYLPEPPRKRRKMNVDEDERCALVMAPISPPADAPPGTPLSGRRARSIALSASGEF